MVSKFVFAVCILFIVGPSTVISLVQPRCGWKKNVNEKCGRDEIPFGENFPIIYNEITQKENGVSVYVVKRDGYECYCCPGEQRPSMIEAYRWICIDYQ